jgi:hypothetical protein
MARTIRCTEARRTLDFDVDQSCDFVAHSQTEDAVLAEIAGRPQAVDRWNEV